MGLYLTANSLAGTLYWAIPYSKQLGWNTVLGYTFPQKLGCNTVWDYTLPQTAWLEVEHCFGLALLRTAKLLKDNKLTSVQTGRHWTRFTATARQANGVSLPQCKQLSWYTVITGISANSLAGTLQYSYHNVNTVARLVHSIIQRKQAGW